MAAVGGYFLIQTKWGRMRHKSFTIFFGAAAFLLAARGWAQGPLVAPPGERTPAPAFQGSVPTGLVSSAPLPLSLDEALQRGLRYNLGSILSQQTLRTAQGDSIVSRSSLLPNVSGYLQEVAEQIDLASFGFRFNPPPSAGFHIPTIVGPFNYFDLRAGLTQKLADIEALRTFQSSRQTQRASELSVQDAREVVVFVVTSSYLQVLAASARVDSVSAQAERDRAIFQQASDRFASGLIARIDLTRSQVAIQTQQQRLTAARAEFSKQKIALARLIGLPLGQEIRLTDAMPYTPLENLALDQAMELAVRNRADLKAAEAQVRAAELAHQAAVAEHYPALGLAADYGVIGTNPAQSHGTFSVEGQLRFPIWAGGRARGDIEQADAALQERRSEYDDLRGRVEAEVRTAFLDMTAAADQVRLAQSRRELAQDELEQATDRFTSGVADTVEVVQAQDAVSSAEEDYIATLAAHNLAKASVARATGQAEKLMRDLLRSK